MIAWLIKTVLVSFVKKGVTLDFLDGYKVYILLIGSLIVPLVGLLGGATFGPVSIPSMTPNEAVVIIWGILTGASFRKALAKKPEQAKAPPVVNNPDLKNTPSTGGFDPSKMMP